MKTLAFRFANEDLVADFARAVYWPRQKALLVADLHLGKSQIFRNAGIALPEGSDEQDLRRLSTLVRGHACDRLWMLGDIVHGSTATDAPWRRAWAEFAAAHGQLAITAIIGNHDRHDRIAMAASAEVTGELVAGPITLRHDPARPAGETNPPFVIAGHVHPLVQLRDGTRRYRLPCFRLGKRALILPAFGSTTRGQLVDCVEAERIIAVSPAGLIELPRTRLRGGR